VVIVPEAEEVVVVEGHYCNNWGKTSVSILMKIMPRWQDWECIEQYEILGERKKDELYVVEANRKTTERKSMLNWRKRRIEACPCTCTNHSPQMNYSISQKF